MEYGQVFVNGVGTVPDWAKQNHACKTAIDVNKLKKLEIKVDLCCTSCEEKVRDAVLEMHGVFDCKTDKTNDLLTIVESSCGGMDHKALLKTVRKALNNNKTGKIVKSKAPGTEKEKPADKQKPDASTSPVIVYQMPFIHGHYNLVPWPSSAPSSSMLITNPNYLQHPVRCGYCVGYTDIVCANCGRGSNW